MPIEQLNQKIKMYMKRQQKRAEGDDEGLNTVQEDMDEFDAIIA
jgi:hypothetical protein